MSQVNALDIQEMLKNTDAISVPWIQSKYELSYHEAKAFLKQLIVRGWVKEEPNGIQYDVVKDNLCLRKIERLEVNKLIENITSDCVSALNCIQKKNATGASLGELISAVRGDDDTNAAIKILTDHRLIYCVAGNYFSRISQVTIKILSDVVKMKREREVNRRMSGKVVDDKDILKLFDELFNIN